METYWLKFYCDTDKERNKLMTWQINSIFDLDTALLRWVKRVNYIRAAWFVTKRDGAVVSSERIDLDRFANDKEIILTK